MIPFAAWPAMRAASPSESTVTVFEIHNGDAAHHLKNESSAHAVPVHGEVVRAGLLGYIRKTGCCSPA